MTLREPIRVVAAPDQAMAADLHLMGCGETNHLVALAEIIGGTIRPQHPPLHGIFPFHYVELTSQGGCVSGLGKLRGADGGADEHSCFFRFVPERLSAAH